MTPLTLTLSLTLSLSLRPLFLTVMLGCGRHCPPRNYFRYAGQQRQQQLPKKTPLKQLMTDCLAFPLLQLTMTGTKR
jgi:hypothetical protein